MTKEDSSVKAMERSPAEKERSSRRTQKKEKVKPPKKIVIRRLPPTMTEEEFLKQIDPLPEHDFYYYAAADWSLGYDATCRAYITLKNEEDVFLFRDRFDGYVFVDSKGAEYPAIVEFAPFQGLLKNKSRRSDNKVNTIEQESHYQQFLAKLEEDREAAAKGGECKLEFTLERKKEEKITSTPLLQYLANKKEKRREDAKKRTEEKRRQREEKEKRQQAQQQQQVTKIISGQDGGGGGKSGGGNKSASGKENVAGDKGGPQQEERKNSRSKRREERNQRRREQYEARKLERERERQEKHGQASSEGGKAETSGEKPEANLAAAGDGKSATEPTSKHTDESKQQQGKESKRYNERRERDRERNRNRKDKLKEKEDKQKEAGANVNAQGGKTLNSSGGETAVNDTVLNFIRSAATPKQKQQAREEDAEEQQRKGDKSTIIKEPKQEGDSAQISSEDKHIQKQRAADEQRRIRNKDRPSIAIYQPKARLRLSEERDGSLQQSGRSNSKGELRSNPTSDCESVKKEEPRQSGGGGKKVSRYSERRAERRNNREKQLASDNAADCKGDGKMKQPHARELRKSKSCENESSVSQADRVVERETAQSGER